MEDAGVLLKYCFTYVTVHLLRIVLNCLHLKMCYVVLYIELSHTLLRFELFSSFLKSLLGIVIVLFLFFKYSFINIHRSIVKYGFKEVIYIKLPTLFVQTITVFQ